MAVEHQFMRLHEAGLRSLPLPSVTGYDDGLLFYCVRPTYIDTVAVWGEKYAVALRVPPERDWANPFESSDAIHRQVGWFEDVVNGLLVPHEWDHGGLGPSTASDKVMDDDWRLVVE